MSTVADHEVNPNLDLVLERSVDVPPDLVWRAWTEPELLKQWFAPRPWTTVHAEIDLRPGGIFKTVMRSPEGEGTGGDDAGCILEVVRNRKLVWTSALGPGFRPQVGGDDDLPFTAIVSMEPHGSGTKYTAIAIHRDETGKNTHEQMGFHDGWGTALDQLVEAVASL